MAQIEKNYTAIRPSSNVGVPRARALFSFLASEKRPPLVIGQIYGVLVIPFILYYVVVVSIVLVIVICTLYQNA
jgi:hypothetical protein